MGAIGKIPERISLLEALDSIGETIIIADTDYSIRWMNTEACRLLEEIAPLYGLAGCADMIGKNMDFFHGNAYNQREMMKNLTKPHRNRITIKGEVVTDIVITPIQSQEQQVDGYIVMLLDVTTQAEEEQKKEELIKELSTPIVQVWHKTIALPLIGEFDQERFDDLIAKVLTECVEKRHEFVLVDLSGMREAGNIQHYLQKLIDSLRLIGSSCFMTGISAQIAISITEAEINVQTFGTVRAGLEHIMKIQKTRVSYQ